MFTATSFSNVGLPSYVLLADILSHTSIKDLQNESKNIIYFFQRTGKIYDEDIRKLIKDIEDDYKSDEMNKLYVFVVEKIQRFMKKNKIRNLYSKEFANAVKEHITKYYL